MAIKQTNTEVFVGTTWIVKMVAWKGQSFFYVNSDSSEPKNLLECSQPSWLSTESNLYTLRPYFTILIKYYAQIASASKCEINFGQNV